MALAHTCRGYPNKFGSVRICSTVVQPVYCGRSQATEHLVDNGCNRPFIETTFNTFGNQLLGAGIGIWSSDHWSPGCEPWRLGNPYHDRLVGAALEDFDLPGASSVPASMEPIITALAPATIALAISPE